MDTPLFLFNFSRRVVYGPFAPASTAALLLEPDAWSNRGKARAPRAHGARDVDAHARDVRPWRNTPEQRARLLANAAGAFERLDADSATGPFLQINYRAHRSRRRGCMHAHVNRAKLRRAHVQSYGPFEFIPDVEFISELGG